MATNPPRDPTTTAEHYARLAASYDELWTHTPEFHEWMAAEVLRIGQPPREPTLADIGGGTGTYARAVLDRVGGQGFLVDPSAEMLAAAPPRPELIPVAADDSHAGEALRRCGGDALDLILIKEAVHHFQDPATSLSELSQLLVPRGSIVIVMLPKQIGYPLFGAALTRFTELQPDPEDIVQHLYGAGLAVTREARSFELRLLSETWLKMVAGRFMSVLATFDDNELTSGLAEIRQALNGCSHVEITDTFEFIAGRKV